MKIVSFINIVKITGLSVGIDFLDYTELKCDEIDEEHGYIDRDLYEEPYEELPSVPAGGYSMEKIVGGKPVWSITNWPFIGSLGGFCGG